MPAHFLVGDAVVVRSLPEIRQTLDDESSLDGLPFMPEMAGYCGRAFRVSRRVERTCVENDWRSHGFPANDVVQLAELRCDGAAHGGCQRGCMLFWKEAWLAPADAGAVHASPPGLSKTPPAGLKTRQAPDQFYCQSTELHRAARPLSRGARVWTFVREVVVGNRTAWQMANHLVRPMYRRLRKRFVDDDPRGVNVATPVEVLDLQPGELVEIKTLDEIVPTLDREGRNHGLGCPFASKIFSGGRYRVRERLERMISEKTGRMRPVANTVSLEGVRCQCYYILGGCPRRELLYWREIWLKRVESKPADVRQPRAS